MRRTTRLAYRLMRDFGGGPFFGSLLFLCFFAVGMDRPVAPLKEPILCVYLRLQEGFTLATGGDGPSEEPRPGPQGGTPEATSGKLRQAMESWRGWRNAMRQEGARKGKAATPETSAPASAPGTSADPQPLVQKLAGDRSFLPEDLYFYFRNPGEFALLLTGTIEPGRWRDLFPEALILPRDQGFAVLVDPGGNGHQMVLHLRNGLAFLAPAELEGNLVDALRDGASGLTERFKTFRAMVQRRPLLAVEADLQALSARLPQGGNSDLVLGEPLSSVSMFRLLLDRQILKAQFHLPEDGSRVEMAALADSLVAGIQAAVTGSGTAGIDSLKVLAGEPTRKLLAGMRSETKGQSVFIEAPGLAGDEALAGLSILGLFASIAENSLQRFRTQFPPLTETAAVPPTGATPVTGAAAVTTGR